ncbi:hypothetical protein QBK99_24825 [Corticibacterium sp. UT-5YL-CI-8]|nr:hypothetical protein [Tianweitania sp. UT-5YL-CI-8]
MSVWNREPSAEARQFRHFHVRFGKLGSVTDRKARLIRSWREVATNHAELLDRAVWRRFQLRLGFPAPDRPQIEVFLDRITSQWPEQPRLVPQKLAAKLGSVSYAEALDFCQNVRRRQILGLGELSIDDALRVELDLWSSRVKPEALDGERSDKTTSQTPTRRTAAKTAGKAGAAAKT